MQPHDLQIKPGAVVLARDGYVGTVDEVLPNPGSGQPEYIVTAPNQTGARLMIPVRLLDTNSPPGELYLRDVFQSVLQQSQTVPAGVDPRMLLSQAAHPADYQANNSSLGSNSRLVVPIIEERLIVNKRTVELGAVELRKTVENFQDTRQVPLTFDQLDVERVSVNRPLEAPVEPRYEGDVLIIPIMEEVLVIEKRLMLTEEVRIHKRQVVQEQEVNETLRREHVEVVIPDNGLVTVNDLKTPAVVVPGPHIPSTTSPAADMPVYAQPTMPNPIPTFKPDRANTLDPSNNVTRINPDGL